MARDYCAKSCGEPYQLWGVESHSFDSPSMQMLGERFRIGLQQGWPLPLA
jgi:hypothetical protein